mgnify:CR=1 FL=1
MKRILYVFALAVLIAGCKSEKQKLTEQIDANTKILFNDTIKMMNEQTARAQVDLYKQYAEKFPDDTISPRYLFKAADVAHGLRSNSEALELYRGFISKYPNHPKAGAGLFLIAFIYDNDMHQADSAKMKYREFLEKYPQHQLAPSAKAALDQLEMGLSDEDLVKMFEARQDSVNKKPN